jgi:uncharacterized repeat protein (TIGR04076 family)
MAEEGHYPQVGHKVTAIIRGVKGTCSMGHKVGDEFEISAYNTAGLCGFFYHDIFPYIVMLQFGGAFPPQWGGGDVVQLECMDRYNAVTIELRRERR